MKKYFFILFYSLIAATAFSQDAGRDVPEWVRLMHQPNTDIGLVHDAYEKYYAEHPFEKNTWTQEYKRLVHMHTHDNNGSMFGLAPDEEKFSEKKYLQNISAQRSTSWECIGPIDFDKEAASKSYAAGAAHIYTVEQSASNPQVLYAGTANAGVWKTVDKGMTWVPLTHNMMISTVKALEIDYSNPDIVYFSGNNEIYKTTDGGQTWNLSGDLAFQSLNITSTDIVMSPVDSLRLWAATNIGLYGTTNGGANWTQLKSGTWQEIEFQPGNPLVMYAVKQVGVRTEFYKSTDGGLTFTIRQGGYPFAAAPDEQKRTEIAVTPAAPNIVYAFATGATDSTSGLFGIYVSHDEGENWTFQCCGTGPCGVPDSATNKNLCAWSEWGDDDGGQYYYDLALEVSPFDSNEVHVCAVNYWVSHDGGITWICPSKWSHSYKINYVHADIHDCHFYGNDWWWACDGGIFYSSSLGDTITRRQVGIAGTDFWGFGMGDWDANEVLVGGTYHNGTLLKDFNTYNNGWLSTMGGDNILGAVNYGYPRVIFSDYGKHKLSGNSNVALNQVTCGMLPSSSYWIGETADMEFSPFCYNKIYIANGNGIWVSNDNGATYTLLDTLGPGKVTAIEASWNNPNVIYAVLYEDWFDSKKLFKTTDGGNTWADITPSSALLNSYYWAPLDIAVSTEDDNRIWLVRTMQSTGSGYPSLNGYKTYFSSDGGATWTNITTPTLNGEYITNVEYQRGSDGVYIGTRRAIYYRNTSMSDWQLYNTSLPVSIVSNELLIDYRGRKIRNATNRSVWQCDLYEPPQTVASMSASSTNITCVRDTVFFRDHSAVTDSNVTWLWSFPGGNPSSSTQREQAVVYSAPGSYSVTLTVSDAYGSDTQTLNNFISVGNGCAPDTIPGMALSVDGETGFAATAPLNLNSNQLTIMAWIKPTGPQNNWAGLLFTRGGISTSGLSIKDDNEIRYHWNGQHWNIPTGLYVPDNKWSHIAMVVAPNYLRVYVNGQFFHESTTVPADEFDSNLSFGFDACCSGRHFKGLIDEVAVYNRPLSQDELREQMHLLKVPANDSSLIAYYQFNEQNGIIIDRVGSHHASMHNGASRVISTGPFGGGSSTSYRTNINSAGTTAFPGTGFSVSFPPAAIVPMGEVVVSRLNLHPDYLPAQYIASRSYWVVDNYGTNQIFSLPDTLHLNGFGPVSALDASVPMLFKLYDREMGEDGATWGPASDSAQFVTAGADGDVAFYFPVSLGSFGQLVMLNSGAPDVIAENPAAENFAEEVIVYPNPSASGNNIIVKSSLTEEITLRITDVTGRELYNKKFFKSTEIPSDKFSAGTYFYSARTATHMRSGMFVVE